MAHIHDELQHPGLVWALAELADADLAALGGAYERALAHERQIAADLAQHRQALAEVDAALSDLDGGDVAQLIKRRSAALGALQALPLQAAGARRRRAAAHVAWLAELRRRCLERAAALAEEQAPFDAAGLEAKREYTRLEPYASRPGAGERLAELRQELSGLAVASSTRRSDLRQWREAAQVAPLRAAALYRLDLARPDEHEAALQALQAVEHGR